MTNRQYHEFLTAYVSCLSWADAPIEEDPESGFYPLSEEAFERAEIECKAFLYRAWSYIEAEGIANAYDQAGHDFLLTRNGHGVGFWDGDWPKYGDWLSKISESFGTLCVWADGGELHTDNG